MTNAQRLWKLMNDTDLQLDVIPLVDSDVVCDDSYARYVGSIGSSEIREYYRHDNEYETKLEYKDNFEDLVSEVMDEKEVDEATAREIVTNYPWKKAIFVNIVLPD